MGRYAKVAVTRCSGSPESYRPDEDGNGIILRDPNAEEISMGDA
jgi:hypothetical protein